MALTNQQLILLDNLIYLDNCVNIEEQNQNNLTVKLVVKELLSKSDDDFEAAITDEQFYYFKNTTVRE